MKTLSAGKLSDLSRIGAGLAVLLVLLLGSGCEDADTAVPTVRIAWPADGAVVEKGVIDFKARVTDNRELGHVDFFINDTMLGHGEESRGDTYVLAWDASGKPNLSHHRLRVAATDAAGNMAAVKVTFMLTGPGPTWHAGVVGHDETWARAQSPHVVNADIFVDSGATLTIEPGCVVKFEAGCGMFCGDMRAGAIVAEGTADAPIVFTSNAALPSRGDWRGIFLYQLALPATSFRNCTLTWGGRRDEGLLHIETDHARVEDCVISQSGDYGIFCVGDNRPALLRNTLVSSCLRYPIRIGAPGVPGIGMDNRFDGNGRDAIEVDGGVVADSATWYDPGVPFFLNASMIVGSDASKPVLTIAPGVTLLCTTGIEVRVGDGDSAGLVAEGPGPMVVFTSSAQVPQPGDWVGISFRDQAIDRASRLSNCKVEYGGASGLGNVMVIFALPELRGDSIGYSGAFGVYLWGDYPPRETVQANNAFYDNVLGSVGP